MPKEFRSATEAKKAESIKRLVRVYGVEGLVEMGVSEAGVALRVPRSRKYVTLSWAKLAASSDTPGDVPAFLNGDPIKMLQHEQQKLVKRALKRAERNG